MLAHEVAGLLLGLFQGRDQFGEGDVGHAAPVGSGSDGEADGEVTPADTRRAQGDQAFLDEPKSEGVEAVELLLLDAGLQGEVDVAKRLGRRQSGVEHRGLQAALITQVDQGAHDRADVLARGRLTAVDLVWEVVERLESSGNLKVGELAAQSVAEGGGNGRAGQMATSTRSSEWSAAKSSNSAAYTLSVRRSTATKVGRKGAWGGLGGAVRTRAR